MSGKEIVLDTNILLYFLEGDKNVHTFVNDYTPVISFISELELLSAPNISTLHKNLINELLEEFTIVNYSEKYKDAIVKIRTQKRLKLPDSIIASLALTLKLPLVTADKVFKNLDGLDLVFYEIA